MKTIVCPAFCHAISVEPLVSSPLCPITPGRVSDIFESGQRKSFSHELLLPLSHCNVQKPSQSSNVVGAELGKLGTRVVCVFVGQSNRKSCSGGSRRKLENLHFRFENFLKVWIGRVTSFFYIELTLNCDLMQSRYALASPLESPLRRIALGWAIKVQLHNSCWRIVESQESTLNLRAINKCNKYVIFSLSSIWLLIKDGLIHHFDLMNIDNFESPCYFPHFDFTVN